MKIKKIVSGIACMVTLAACNLDYHEYANYGKDYTAYPAQTADFFQKTPAML